MFQTILKKLLIKYLGSFIQGLDKNKLSLGVFSGDIIIENVSLKENILEMLDLPMSIWFSDIGRL